MMAHILIRHTNAPYIQYFSACDTVRIYERCEAQRLANKHSTLSCSPTNVCNCTFAHNAWRVSNFVRPLLFSLKREGLQPWVAQCKNTCRPHLPSQPMRRPRC
ncbi:unnamed protein product, partial [Pylaiella littoralis]